MTAGNTYSVEAEQSVLGRLLIDNAAWDRVGDLLDAADFYRHEHKAIFSELGRLINSGKPADIVTVFESLKERGSQDFGGLEYLNALANGAVTGGSIRRHAEIIRERSILRGLLAKIDEASELALSPGVIAEKLDKVANLFSNIDSNTKARGPKSLSDVLVEVIDNINDAASGELVFWRTGVPGVDWRLGGGLAPGDLVILAARPSVGKTSFALQLAQNFASDGLPVLVLNQEMINMQSGRRILANKARVNMRSIKTGKLTDEEWGRVAEGVDKAAKLPIYLDDEPSLSMPAINSKARSIKGLRVLFVDYLQLCEGEGDNRTQQVGSVSRGLKALAKRQGCVVVALSQLNRGVDARADKRPVMSDLRDSGEIEQDADIIIFLSLLGDEAIGGIQSVCLDMAKVRDGETGALVVTRDGAHQIWHESTLTLESFRPKKQQGGFD